MLNANFADPKEDEGCGRWDHGAMLQILGPNSGSSLELNCELTASTLWPEVAWSHCRIDCIQQLRQLSCNSVIPIWRTKLSTRTTGPMRCEAFGPWEKMQRCDAWKNGWRMRLGAAISHQARLQHDGLYFGAWNQNLQKRMKFHLGFSGVVSTALTARSSPPRWGRRPLSCGQGIRNGKSVENRTVFSMASLQKMLIQLLQSRRSALGFRLGRPCWAHTCALEISLPDMWTGVFARQGRVPPELRLSL